MALYSHQNRMDRSYGKLHVRAEIPDRDTEWSDNTLPFEIWIFVHDATGPILSTNHSIRAVISRPNGVVSTPQQRPVRLPVVPGSLSDCGGFLQSQAMIWKPFTPLSAELLLRIERLRDTERGLTLEIEVQADIVPLHPTKDGPITLRLSNRVQLRSDLWREMLSRMGWPTPRVFELHPNSFSDLAEFHDAAASLQQAEQLLQQGHWAECAGKCRVIVEAVFKQLGYKGKEPYDWSAYEKAGLPSEMSQIFQAFNRVANRPHHPGQGLKWERADARFLLQMAASLAEYAGVMGPRVVQPASPVGS